MSLSPIPDTPFPIDPTQWESFAGHFERLLHVPLDEANVRDWLREWSDLNRLVDEAGAIVYIESTLDTADPAREQAFLNYVENVDPNYRRAEQALKERLLAFAADDDAFGPEMRLSLIHI